MLIRRAELEGGAIADVRIEHGRVTKIGALEAQAGEPLFEARGGLLLPGLHDHHIHIAGLAASLDSIRCGPPEVTTADELAAALQVPGQGWVRGIGYHESVAGMLDAAMLDRVASDRPIRIQHRSGRMWFFNSSGLDHLLASAAAPAGLECKGDRFTGRLFDEDVWLRRALHGQLPPFAQVGTLLSECGVTGLTDMSPGNDAHVARHFVDEQSRGALPQDVLLAGSLSLTPADMGVRTTLGAAKLHLHEAALPPFEAACGFIRQAHRADRNVAVHCATEVELVFALAAFSQSGVEQGDRIEHASISPDSAVGEIARLGLAVVTQPHFVNERGDDYRRDVAARHQACLYRLRAFLEAGVTLAGGSDAPFGHFDPWAAMAAAMSRRTAGGAVIGEAEALSAEEALDLCLRAPDALDRRRRVEVGGAANLCLLDLPWAQSRAALSRERVRATFKDGRPIYDRVDNPPLQGGRGVEPPSRQDHQCGALTADPAG